MRVLIDGSIYSSAPSGGIFKYFNEILPRLSQVEGTSVVVLAPKGSRKPPEGSHIEVQASNLGLGRYLPQGAWRKWLSPLKKGVENALVRMKNTSSESSVFHSAYYSLSPIPKIPQLLTVYDAISEVLPEFQDLPFHQELTKLKTQSLPYADRLLAISQTTKNDICAHFGISPDKIDVTPLGIDVAYYQIRSPKTAALQTLPENYLLYVGGRLNHKNFPRLIEAYAQSAVRAEIPFVVAGGAWNEAEAKLLKKHGVQEHFHLVKNPTDEEVRTLYQNAKAFVYPSLYEGFGMPLLEAFASGTPVATSRAGSLPEVAGEGALYFDPRNPNEMAKVLEEVVTPEKTALLQSKAQARLQEYSWDKTAQLTYQSYQRSLATNVS